MKARQVLKTPHGPDTLLAFIPSVLTPQDILYTHFYVLLLSQYLVHPPAEVSTGINQPDCFIELVMSVISVSCCHG